MKAINRKLLRDLWHMRGQFAAIALVMACGVAMFVMSLATLYSLELTQQTYYERYRFSHVFAHLKRAPAPLAARLAAIAGVAAVQTRVVAEVNLDVPGFSEPAVGRLVSVADRQRPGLNELHLRRGRYLEPGRSGEVLAGEGFVEAHGLKPGDHVWAVINGRRRRLEIVGVALSPEYVYQIAPGEVFPNDRTFGVFWMGQTELAAAFDMEGAFNDAALSLLPGADEAAVIAAVDRLTAPYGGLGAYGRDEQVSNRYVTNEIRELRNMASVAPVIFLGVAAFLLNVVLSRIVNTQREEIAALKAFGYHKWEIGWLYLKMVLLVVLVSVVLGTALGAWFGRSITTMYTRFFRFPVLEFQLEPRVLLGATAASTAAALLGTFGAVRRAVRLPPAEAMRPEPPARYRRTLVERLGLGRLLSPGARMILRHIERRPVAAALSVVGIALAGAILVLGSFVGDSLDYLMEFQFDVAQRHDVSVALVEPASSRAAHEMARLPGVLASEPFRAVAVRLRFGHRQRREQLLGLDPDPTLFRLVDDCQRPVDLPPQGIVLNTKLAELLGAAPGDVLAVEVLEGRRPHLLLPLGGVFADMIETSAYIDRRELARLLNEQDTVSGAFLDVDPARLDELYATLKATPGVAAVTIKNAARRSLEETIAESMLRMKQINVLFACVIAFGVVYNMARISVAERGRDLASLRVLGFTRGEISGILLGELAVLTALAVPLGMWFGYLLAWFATWGYDTELFRMPLVILPSTYAFSALVVIAASAASGLVVRRRLDRLDLIAVLKTRE